MKNIYCKIVLVALLLGAAYAPAGARECTQCKKANAKNAAVRTKAAGCKRAQSTAELNVNNVRAMINGYGNMWFDGQVPQYHIPRNANTCPLYCAALWIGGTDVNDQIRLAALTFGSYGDDFWPGPLKIDNTASIDPETCTKYDKHWIITKAEVQDHMSKFNYKDAPIVTVNEGADLGNIPDVILNWPASGNADDLTRYLAPFMDADEDGEYHPDKGDYPYYDFTNELCPRTKKANLKRGAKYVPDPTMESLDPNGKVKGGLLSDQVLKGDQTIWWVFNDKGNTHTESDGNEIGLEIRAQAFAFSTNDEINNMTFYSYEIINRSTYTLQETYFSQWVDPDLGHGKDDYVGCDVRRGLGYCYNGDEQDGPGSGSYSGIPPAVGIDFFQGPYMDPDGKDNPKINIEYILSPQNNNNELRTLLEKYKYFDTVYNKWCYDTISISDDADLFYNIDYKSWWFKKDSVIGNCAINGVNFGNNIVDDERFGMRRFVYYDNPINGNDDNTDPSKAPEYYNYLRGYWKNNQRMKYGGNALRTDVTDLDCDFMFPGETDPWHWGTNGDEPDAAHHPMDWNEITAGNKPGDRRFMQSAGPFTLKPGAVNYITVGIPFAQATSGNAWSSVERLREIDDVCQSLFENCFKVLEGPEAPTLTCQELKNEVILYLHYDNPNSNNYNEKYSEEDPKIVHSYVETSTADSIYTVATIDTIIGLDTTYKYSTITVPVTTETTKSYTLDQRSYKFEGYMIYQLKDATVSVADINDVTKARLVAQCDVENYYDSVDADGNVNSNPSLGIGTLTNYTTNSATGLLTGKVMVEGANKGIQHVFRVTTDLFATGTNNSLVNNREYYFIAIAYAHNRFKPYSQTEAAFLDGQKEPFLAGRKNENSQTITPIVAIPHDPAVEDGGKLAQSEFGMCPNIIRLEGYGNGGSVLRLTEASINQLMGEPNSPAMAPGTFVESFSYTGVDNSHMNAPAMIVNPEYEENYGPVNVRVIDPLKIKEGKYKIMFKNVGGGSEVTGDTRWFVMKENEDGTYQDTVWSDFSISRKNEQLFLDLGIAITLVNPKPAATALNDPKYDTNNNQYYFGGFANAGALLNASMTFDNENLQWVMGIPDNDANPYYNWIRSGNQFAPGTKNNFILGTTKYNLMRDNYLDEDYHKAYEPSNATSTGDYVYEAYDKNQVFENVVGGTWSPYALVSTLPFHPGFNFSYYMPEESVLDSLEDKSFYSWSFNRYRLERQLMNNFYNRSLNFNDMAQLPSIRVVFTADTTKWTRCPVIEMCDDYTQSEGNARKFSARRHASVNKKGQTLADVMAENPGYVSDPNNDFDPNYISENGMGWFPGYAINTVTGERLNIMFGEDSRYVQFNGRDMMWNPVSKVIDGTENYVYGGRHYIYIMNACQQSFVNITKAPYSTDVVTYRTPSYDAGRWSIKMLGASDRLMSIRETQTPRNLYAGFIGAGAETGRPIPVRDTLALLYASVAWVNMPYANPRYEFKYPGNDATLNAGKPSNGIPTTMTVDIDVRMPYNRNMSQNATTSANCGVSSANGGMPAYQFIINKEDAVLENLATRKDARKEYVDSLLGMINVVPNPYYSYDNFETTSQLETKVRIINLPSGIGKNGQKEGAYVKIYTVDGTLVRTLGPTDPSDQHSATTLDWDLHNHTGLPIAGGVYLIHVSVPGIGERVIKWFGTMRPVDLNSFQF